MIERRGNSLRIGRVFITADRWPWQLMSQASPYNARPNKRWGWGPVGGMGRFGGGWEFCLGVRAGSWTSWYLELGLGMVRLSTHPPHSFKELRR